MKGVRRSARIWSRIRRILPSVENELEMVLRPRLSFSDLLKWLTKRYDVDINGVSRLGGVELYGDAARDDVGHSEVVKHPHRGQKG